MVNVMTAQFSRTEPLNENAIRVFDDRVDTYFRLIDRERYFAAQEVIDDARNAMEMSGFTLFGDKELVKLVVECLGEGPREGDVLAALSVLYDMGVVELTGAALSQVDSRMSEIVIINISGDNYGPIVL